MPSSTRAPRSATGEDTASIGSLLRRLGSETGELVRAEIELARLEARDMIRQAVLEGARLGAALALAFVGLLALTAAAVLALGDVLGGRHASAALILGAVLLLIGAILAWLASRGLRELRAGAGNTIEGLQADGRMAAAHLQGMKQDLLRGRDESESQTRLPEETENQQ